VARVAQESGVDVVDARSLFEGVEGRDSLFTDLVHPSPQGARLLASAVAPLLAAGVPADGTAGADREESATVGSALRVVSVTPREVSTLGDQRVRVTLAGWDRSRPLPALVLGGAVLLDPKVVGDRELEATVPANGAGKHGLVVQTADAVAFLPDAVEAVPPRITLVEDGGPRLVLTSRPGDEALLVASAKRLEYPAWDERGPRWLDLGGLDPGGVPEGAEPGEGSGNTPGARGEEGPRKGPALRQRLILDEHGVATLPLPSVEAVLGGAPVLWLQALVAPPGENPNSSVARWTGVFALRSDG
jgi:hypothetical protein